MNGVYRKQDMAVDEVECNEYKHIFTFCLLMLTIFSIHSCHYGYLINESYMKRLNPIAVNLSDCDSFYYKRLYGCKGEQATDYQAIDGQDIYKPSKYYWQNDSEGISVNIKF
ncbi:hypothetical protein AVEN_104894-1 [Araneus ventricosus]|uniref:Uncharacterized protein n=1 Tax=Araneus ventricosus TaxID=182803 RepID=A0A4Y2FJB3_ARAVE|nr:hypothetical protein AVEN_104894-1 [Araneus ventricosus]